MKIGYFITARLKSTRLKQKILLPLNEQSVLDHVIKRCKAVNGIDGTVLCTSINPQDSALYKFALKHKIEFYPGSENDVLKRLEDAAIYYGYDAFVSITADNPLHSMRIAYELIELYLEKNCDFIFAKGLPIGIAPYFIKTNALNVANYMKNENDTEIWGPFVNRPDFFNIGELHILNSIYKEEIRLTCDVMEDYKLFKLLFSKIGNNDLIDITEINKILDKNPEILLLNKSIIQRKVSEEVIEKINNNFNKMIISGKNYAQKMGIQINPGINIKSVSI